MQALKKSALKKQKETNDELEAIAKEYGLGVRDKSLERLENLRNDLSQFSTMAQMEFVEYVRRKLNGGKVNHADELVVGFARLFGVSVPTAKRYMKAACAYHGPLARSKDMVFINPHYVAPEKDDYWWDEDENDIPEFIK